MAVFRIAVIGGDGIGPEVIDQAIRVADAAARKHDGAELEWNRLPWSTRLLQEARPDAARRRLGARCKQHDAILFGAVGDPTCPTRSPFTTCCCRCGGSSTSTSTCGRRTSSPACRARSSARSPARSTCSSTARTPRANTPRSAAGSTPARANEIAIQTGVFTRRGCERILRAAFEAARKRPRRSSRSITKSNAQVCGMGLWDEAFNAVREGLPRRADAARCSSMPRRWTSSASRRRSTWWWRATCSATS